MPTYEPPPRTSSMMPRTQAVDVPKEHRWSEIIPPHTALTFAAVWDPHEGMVTFSGAHLLDSASAAASADAPRDADGQSQVLTMLASTAPSFSTAMLLDGYDIPTVDYSAANTPCWEGLSPEVRRVPQSPAFASSITLGVAPPSIIQANATEYRQLLVHRAMIANARRQPPVPPPKTPEIRVQAASTVSVEEDDSEPVEDEGFCEAVEVERGALGSSPALVNANLNSRFSVTTTSTNNYVHVDFPVPTPGPSEKKFPARPPHQASDDTDSTASSVWTTLQDLDRAFCISLPFEQRRRLKKRRTDGSSAPQALYPTHSRGSSESSHSSSSDAPASPAEVLARKDYNHVTPVSSPGSSSSHSSGPPPSKISHPKALLHRVTSRQDRACEGDEHTRERKASALLPKASLLEKLGRYGHGSDGWVCVDVEHRVTQRLV